VQTCSSQICSFVCRQTSQPLDQQQHTCTCTATLFAGYDTLVKEIRLTISWGWILLWDDVCVWLKLPGNIEDGYVDVEPPFDHGLEFPWGPPSINRYAIINRIELK